MKSTELLYEAKSVLLELVEGIKILSHDEFTQKIELLGNSTIGEHTRHVIEMFHQLYEGYDSGIVDYDNRKRNITIQENIDFATECIAEIVGKLDRIDKPLQLKSLYLSDKSTISTNYTRELMYNIEHCIHHQAILKVAFLFFGKENLSKSFGVSRATILSRNNVYS